MGHHIFRHTTDLLAALVAVLLLAAPPTSAAIVTAHGQAYVLVGTLTDKLVRPGRESVHAPAPSYRFEKPHDTECHVGTVALNSLYALSRKTAGTRCVPSLLLR